MHVRRQPGWLQSPVASLSARWGGRRLPCLTGRFRYGGKQKTVMSESSCAIRVHRGEREPRIPYGRHSGTRRGIGRSGVGWAWLPAEDSNLVERFQRPVCCRYTSGECVGVLAESPTKIRRSHLVRHRSRTQWHVHDRVRAALTRPALPSVDSNHDAGIQNPVCYRLHQRGRVCALAGSWTGLRKMNPSPPPSFPRSAI